MDVTVWRLLIELIALGIVFYLVSFIPMAEPFPAIIRVVAVLVAIVIVLHFLLGTPLFLGV